MNRNHSEKPLGLLNLYFNFNSYKLLLFLGIVVLTTLVVTGIYVSIFGFNSWQSNMSQAGSLMLANFPTPIANTVDPNTSGSIASQPNASGVATPPAAAPLNGGSTNQFVCPNCGPVGLPNVSTNGMPLCPNCGTVMGVGNQSTP